MQVNPIDTEVTFEALARACAMGNREAAASFALMLALAIVSGAPLPADTASRHLQLPALEQPF